MRYASDLLQTDNFNRLRQPMQLSNHRLSKLILPGIVAAALSVAAPTPAATHIFYWGDNSSIKTNVPAAATNIISVIGGDDHLLALRADGCVLGWGLQTFGERNVPADVTNAAAIAAGSCHSLALLDNGTVRFWGKIYTTGVTSLPPALGGQVLALAVGSSAQSILALRSDNSVVDCGNPSYGLTNVPPAATNISAMTVGSSYAAVVGPDRQVVAWGQFYPYGDPKPPYYLSNVVAIAGGMDRILALQSDGKLFEWYTTFPSPPGTGIPAAATNIVAIAAGGRHNVALRADGKLFAWGDNTKGQLNIPPDLTNIVSIAATTWGSLALTADDGPPLLGRTLANPAVLGTTARLQVTAISTTPLGYQWYFNGVELTGATTSTLTLPNIQPGQAGTYSVVVTNRFGAATNSNLNLAAVPSAFTMQPMSQTALIGDTALFNVAAISQTPAAFQWRLNGTDLPGATDALLRLTNLQPADAGVYSVLVSNNAGQVLSSSAVLTVLPFRLTSVPQDQFSFPGGSATMTVGVQCNLPFSCQWQFEGTPLDGATASSLAITNLQYPQAGLYSVVISAAGTNTTSSARLNITPIAQFGQNWNGMGTIPWALTNVVALANGNAHTLALKSDGSVVGWGLMLGTLPPGLTNVAAVAAGDDCSVVLNSDGTVAGWGGLIPPPELTNVVAIAAGFHHALAVRADGTVAAWGDNSYGQTNVPPGLTNVVTVAGGEWHSMALDSRGSVTAWGAGAGAVTGSPNYGQSRVPPGLTNVVAIAACAEFSLALRSDGIVQAWGDNLRGQTNVPAGLSNVVAIAAAWGTAFALRADGTVLAWGDNFNGQTNLPAGLSNVTAIFGSDARYAAALVGEAPPVLHANITNPAHQTGTFSFAFPSQSGRVYMLEYKSALDDSDWTPLPLFAGNGRLLTVTDTTAAGQLRFYRIRRW